MLTLIIASLTLMSPVEMEEGNLILWEVEKEAVSMRMGRAKLNLSEFGITYAGKSQSVCGSILEPDGLLPFIVRIDFLGGFRVHIGDDDGFEYMHQTYCEEPELSNQLTMRR